MSKKLYFATKEKGKLTFLFKDKHGHIGWVEDRSKALLLDEDDAAFSLFGIFTCLQQGKNEWLILEEKEDGMLYPYEF